MQTYSEEDVCQHNTVDTKIWVSYWNGVYDVTDYVQLHPGGGDVILQVAG